MTRSDGSILAMSLSRRILALAQSPLSGSDVDHLHEELSQFGEPHRQPVERDVDRGGRHRIVSAGPGSVAMSRGRCLDSSLMRELAGSEGGSSETAVQSYSRRRGLDYP
jgi:hypothetical protein